MCWIWGHIMRASTEYYVLSAEMSDTLTTYTEMEWIINFTTWSALKTLKAVKLIAFNASIDDQE